MSSCWRDGGEAPTPWQPGALTSSPVTGAAELLINHRPTASWCEFLLVHFTVRITLSDYPDDIIDLLWTSGIISQINDLVITFGNWCQINNVFINLGISWYQVKHCSPSWESPVSCSECWPGMKWARQTFTETKPGVGGGWRWYFLPFRPYSNIDLAQF